MISSRWCRYILTAFFFASLIFWGSFDIDSQKKMDEIKIKWNWSDWNQRRKELFLKRISLHKMIHPRFWWWFCCVDSLQNVSVLYLLVRPLSLTILRVSAHVIWILCDLITAYNKLHIHAMLRIYYNVDIYVYFFLAVVIRWGIIIRAAKSVDNLQRIVIQNGQPLLIKHCPKCRETYRQSQYWR